MSFSVPTSPVMSRSSKAQPVTPQRLPKQQLRSQSFYRSPLTPSTSPYTPMSLRSFDSTGSSILATPDTIGMNIKKRLAFSALSPDMLRAASANQEKSIADIADNWRSRASENGIKVAFGPQDDSGCLPDDSSDMSLSDVANDSVILSSEDALLAAPSFPVHRRLNSLPVSGASRPRAQSHASLPRSRVHPSSPVIKRNHDRAPLPVSPLQPRRGASSLNHSLNLMSTPPPNRALARQLKLKGSLTDPAQPRRREAFGSVSTVHNMSQRNMNMSLTLEPDTSLDLFDIDENDFEYDNDYQESEVENSFSRNLQALQAQSYGYPIFAPRYAQGPGDRFNQPAFSDPFHPGTTSAGLLSGHMLNGIAESVEHHFQALCQPPPQKPFYDDIQNGHVLYPTVPRTLQPQYNHGAPHAYPTPAFIPIPQPSLMPLQSPGSMHHNSVTEHSFTSSSKSYNGNPFIVALNPTDCSVCLATHPATLAILQPCKHPLCSACLTSALNIVGEKDMECAVCKQSVASFNLVMGSTKPSQTGASVAKDAPASSNGDSAPRPIGDQADRASKSFMNPLFSSSPNSLNVFDHEGANTSNVDLESAFGFGGDLEDLRASTPKMTQMQERSWSHPEFPQKSVRRGDDYVVLRIDNVPWDITPLQIINWLQQPVERVHVLLDSKGKTLSHAYVEVKNAAIAGAILRGEAQSSSGKKERGSVLGRGKRARGVTVTRSGQQELMGDLFPHWRGSFDGSRPSLAGVEGNRGIGTLEGGLLTEHEISGLMYLIREPDSHFLKVPSLPFHSLISILSKFPTDVDSRVFWSANIRDMLFDATHTAIKVLMPRINKAKETTTSASSRHHEEEFTMDLAVDLVHTALDCKAFTVQQTHLLVDLAQSCSLPLPEYEQSQISDSSAMSASSALRTSLSQDSSTIMFKQRMSSQANGDSSLDDLAKEFGIDTFVVHQLAQRLSKLS